MKNNASKKYKKTVFGIIIVAIILIPIYFVFIYSFQSNQEIYHQPPYLFPPNPQFSAYKIAWESLKPHFLNSVIISTGVVIFTLVISIPSAFSLSKLNIKFKNAISYLMVFVQILPASVIVVPLFLLFFNLNLINTYIGTILAVSTLTIPFDIVILRSYMEAFPFSLIEAAQIDGASLLKIFFKIIIPLSRPAIITATIFAFIFSWGDFIFSLTLLQQNMLQPLGVGLYYFTSEFGVQWNNLMAASVIYSLPVLIIVMIAGNYLVSGLTAGAFKE